VDLYEDVRDVGANELSGADLICGGFPCQDLSVAGRRAGLDGARSGLWFEFRRIVAELAPTWVLVENVPGLLSSNGGADLAVILRGLAELGYVGAWRVLDSQHFGVAQRRRRVFLLACRDPRAGCPAQVLAIAEGMSGHPAPSREAWQGVAGGTQGGAVGPLRCATPGLGGVHADDEHTVASTLSAHTGIHDGGGQTYVAHTLRAEGHDASEDGTGRGVPLVVSETGKGWWSEGAGPLRADPGGMPSHIAFDTTQVPSKANRSNPKPGDPCHPLSAGAHPPALAQAITAEMYRSGGATAGNNPGVRNVFGAIPRRLTPRECERLQGFPDDWTRYADDGSGLADSPRYRMLGNAVTVSVAEWIGSRLALEPHP
jgi:DNA (cytosine-5)-methyltransferase 1